MSKAAAEMAADEKQAAVLARILARKAARLAAPRETLEERVLRVVAERAAIRFANQLGAAAPLLAAHEFLGGPEVTERLVRDGYLGYDPVTAMVTCRMG